MPRGSQQTVTEQLPETTSADLAAAKREADELTTRILELREAYYGGDTVLVDDAEYDAMMHRLEELERRLLERTLRENQIEHRSRLGPSVQRRANDWRLAPIAQANGGKPRCAWLNKGFAVKKGKARSKKH